MVVSFDRIILSTETTNIWLKQKNKYSLVRSQLKSVSKMLPAVFHLLWNTNPFRYPNDFPWSCWCQASLWHFRKYTVPLWKQNPVLKSAIADRLERFNQFVSPRYLKMRPKHSAGCLPQSNSRRTNTIKRALHWCRAKKVEKFSTRLNGMFGWCKFGVFAEKTQRYCLSGEGGLYAPARWTPQGFRAVYTESIVS